MEPFIAFEGVAVPLHRSDVDTDQIIPARFMKRITKSGYEDGLFSAWREDPAFVLNQPEYGRASILVAGPNFGTGSSREHAVWALRDYGFRAVLSSRFADIFRGNAGKQGLLAAELDGKVIEEIWSQLDAAPGRTVRIDLEQRTVKVGDRCHPFRIDDYTRAQLLEGLDEIDATLLKKSQIERFERERPSWMPAALPARH